MASTRESLQKALISEEEKRELREEILPFWEGKTVEDRLAETSPTGCGRGHGQVHLHDDAGDHVRHRPFHDGPLEGAEGGSQGHHRGGPSNAGTRLSAEQRSGEKGLFYEAVVRSLKAAVRFAHRYADLAEAMAREREGSGPTEGVWRRSHGSAAGSRSTRPEPSTRRSRACTSST